MRRCDNCKRNLFCDSVWKTSGDRVTSCVSWMPIITNADKIRTMTDEELAELLHSQFVFGNSYLPSEWWLDWLKQDAKNER